MTTRSRSLRSRGRWPWRRLAGGIVACALALHVSPRPARAWDPSTTHLGLTDRAVLDSALHIRWMAASELQRGLFTPLRVDPDRLRRDEWRLFMQTANRAHASSGVRPLGGPGSCPGADAPPATNRYCVQGDLWQLTALQWIEFGVLAELTPSAREAHHFVDPQRPSAPTWSARGESLPRAVLRSRQTRHNGASTAEQLTGTGFAGAGPSATAWVADPADPLAPTRMFEHLELASLSADAAAREHHLAVALVCAGALLHVAQNLTVPAHARADVAAFFRDLSANQGDRGLPLQELARLRYGRSDLPVPPADPDARGRALAASIGDHLIGSYLDGRDGAAAFARSRFLSSGTLPEPMVFPDDISAEDAAAKLLEDSLLDPSERDGARLTPWPAESGYLVTGAGRPLLAFELDADGFYRCFLDDAVLGDHMTQLLPRAVEVSRSLLDTIFPAWPEIQLRTSEGTLEFILSATLEQPELLIIVQDEDGGRSIVKRFTLLPGKRNRVRGVPDDLTGGARVVLVLRATRPGGDRLVLEHVLAPDADGVHAVPARTPPERASAPNRPSPAASAKPDPLAAPPSAATTEPTPTTSAAGQPARDGQTPTPTTPAAKPGQASKAAPGSTTAPSNSDASGKPRPPRPRAATSAASPSRGQPAANK